MEASWLAIYQGLLLISALVLLFLSYQAFVQRNRRGAKPLFVVAVGALCYVGVKLAVSLVRATPTVFFVSRFTVLGSALATTGFVLVVLEYTDVEYPLSKRTVALLSVEPVVVNALIWVDVGVFWVPTGVDASTASGFAWELQSAAIANQLYMGVLVIVGSALLVRFGRRSETVFHSQVTMLLVAALGPFLGNLVYYLGYVPLNLAPILFVFTGVVVSWAILWEGFLDLTPLGQGAVIDNLDAGVLTVDSNHRLIDVNESGRRIFDLDGAAVGEHIDDVFADRPVPREVYWSLTDTHLDQEREVEFDDRYYAVEMTRLTKTRKTLLGRSLIVRDITDRKRRELDLRKFEQAIEHAGYGIVITEPDGTITYVNSAMEAQTGYAAAELVGATPNVLSSGTHGKALFARLWDTILDGEVWEGEIINEHKTGAQYTISQTIAPITDDGEVLAFVAVNHDITERKEHEQRIEDQRDGLDLLNQIVRHDIRNDLQLVLAYAELLEQEVDADSRSYVEQVLESTQNAVDLTVDARELAEVMLRSETPREAVVLAEPLTAAVERLQESVDDAIVVIDGSIPATQVQGDELLSSIFRNLLKNAIQHNDEPVPEVRVSATDCGDHVEVCIVDNGPGVPDAQKTTIFGRGEKGLESDGTGIGLYLVNTLVENYGGDVWVEDRAGSTDTAGRRPQASNNDPKGARFVVELPTAG